MHAAAVNLSGFRLFHSVCLPPPACRRTRALLLQLCAAAEAAARAGDPLAAQVQAAWSGSSGSSGLPRLLGVLLEACGSLQSSTAVELSGSLLQGLVSACVRLCSKCFLLLQHCVCMVSPAQHAWQPEASRLCRMATSRYLCSPCIQRCCPPSQCRSCVSTRQSSFTPVPPAGRCTGAGGV